MLLLNGEGAMRKFEMTERDIRELWRLAKQSPHVPDYALTAKQIEMGFKSGFVDNGHGGYWSMRIPRWMSLTTVAKDFLRLLSKHGVYDNIPQKDLDYINSRYHKLKL